MDNVVSGIYKHFKGGYVLVLFTAKHSDREEIEVVYKGLNNGKFYARPIESFCDIVTNDSGDKVPRFTVASLDEVTEFIMDKDVANLLAAFKNNN
ncbi:MAG: DUF1653 domain-containing protein [Clostridia bacterium]|nr:DUF1653 domain-containing protein [Clostridia bacterium]